jgi:hypothetical protein
MLRCRRRAASSAHIERHPSIDGEGLVEASYRLNAERLRLIVETQIRVQCHSLMFRQIDADECHRHCDTTIEASEVLINAGDLSIEVIEAIENCTAI